MVKNKKSKLGYKVLMVILCVILAFCSYKVIPFILEWLNDNKTVEQIKDTVDEVSEDDFSKEAWNALYAQNSDLKAYMVMKSDNGTIDIEVPITQSDNDNYYLKHSFLKEYSTMGTPFFTSDAMLDGTDDNVMIYGHYVLYDKSKMFSPLNLFLNNQDIYDHCKTFKIYYENEVVEYEIVSIFSFDYARDYEKHEYTARIFYSEDEFNDWNKYNLEHSSVQTDYTSGASSTEYGDKFVTLQTCTYVYSSKRTLVVAKQVNKRVY